MKFNQFLIYKGTLKNTFLVVARSKHFESIYRSYITRVNLSGGFDPM